MIQTKQYTTQLLQKLRADEALTIFVLLASIFGLIFVATNPPGFGLDERAHFMRAYEVSQGNLTATTVGKDHRPGAAMPKNLTDWVGASTSDLLDNNTTGLFTRHDADPSRYKVFFHKGFSPPMVDDFPSNAQLAGTFNYNPIGYLHLGLAIKLVIFFKGSILTGLYAARIVNLILYIAIASIAIWITPRFKWLFVATALLPTSIFQASMVSVDPLINSLSFLITALLFKSWYDKKQFSVSIVLIIILLTSILAVTKQPYLLLGGLFLMIPNSHFSNSTRAWTMKGLIVVVPVVIGLAWTHIGAHATQAAIKMYFHASFTEQLHFVMLHPLSFLAAMVRTYFEYMDNLFASMTGWVGDRLVGVPIVLMAGFSVCSIGIAGLLRQKHPHNLREIYEPMTNKLIIGAITIGITIGISLSLYLSFNPVGAPLINGIQGRYFIPLIPITTVLLVNMIPLNISPGREITARKLIIASSLSFLALTSMVYAGVNY
jgi:uncharacterized membrane protein